MSCNNKFRLLIRCFVVVVCSQYSAAQILEVSSEVFPSGTEKGFVAAYADVNNDKYTDVFMVKGTNEINILAAATKNLISLSHLQTVTCNCSGSISALFPADYNADGYLDLLVTTSEQSKQESISLFLTFGTKSRLLSGNFVPILSNVKDQPLLLDANADMIPDLFLSLSNNSRLFLLGHTSPPATDWNYKIISFIASTVMPSLYEMRVPHSCAFVDTDADGNAELVVTSINEKVAIYETWKGTATGLNQSSCETLDLGANFEIGQSVFVDLDGDSIQEHLVPVCEIVGMRCNQSKIFAQRGEKWVEVFVAEPDWNFVSIKQSHMKQPITLITGDYNQDTFIDILCIMQNKLKGDSTTQETVILFGKQCSEEYCQIFGHQFKLSLIVPNSEGSFSSSFFDLSNDGSLDVFVSVAKLDGLHSVHAYRNTLAIDASFLFVKILSGKTKTGSNVAGGTVSYSTINTMGGMLQNSATQLSQTAHLSLQLPYVSFSLGRLPNFVDQLQVAVPSCLLPSQFCAIPYISNHNQSKKLWTMIIPNSQMYVVPHPPSDSSRWTNELLVTPGHNLLDTLAVLVATCAVVAIAIVTLHCMERREDRQEKIQEAHRFHFDAM
uniref:T-cell immunomodulatory protein-like n=1 Tax=Phallusia mammillata TaxID=59560 RepID=A0A6F9DFW2_9ASCI|nr:T-cell immunomodulatory protein-like [Phallusia mammillata]